MTTSRICGLTDRSDYEIPIEELRARTARLRGPQKPYAAPSQGKPPRKHLPLITGRVASRLVRLMDIAAARDEAAEKAANENGRKLGRAA